MENNEILLAEYNNLWQEKIAHKTSLRKLKGYVSYFTSIISGSLTIFGLSSSEIFKSIATAENASSLANNITNTVNVISVPAVPIILLLASYAINELYQIYVIGNHIGNIEGKINKMTNCNIFTWEHKVCPVVYGGRKTKSGKKLVNIIALNDIIIFFPFAFILTIVMAIFAIRFTYLLNIYLCYAYAALLLLMVAGLMFVAWRLYKYTNADSDLTKAITEASNS